MHGAHIVGNVTDARTTDVFELKIRARKEAKELRKKLKDVPAPCRAMFIKMHDLKKNTNVLENNWTQKRKSVANFGKK